MPEVKGRPFFVYSAYRKDIERSHGLYAKLPFLKTDYALIKGIKKNGTLLEVGCNDGRYLKRVSLMRNDLRLIGLDLADYLESISPQELDLFALADCNQPLPFKDESMDFIHCSHVIEHIWQPLLLMKEIFRILKKDGRAYIEAPGVRTVFLPTLGRKGIINFFDDPTHLRPYTKESLRRLALQAGFEENGIKVFSVRNGFNFLFFPYLLFKFITTGYSDYLNNMLQFILALEVGAIITKNKTHAPGAARDCAQGKS